SPRGARGATLIYTPGGLGVQSPGVPESADRPRCSMGEPTPVGRESGRRANGKKIVTAISF
ncbi:hypothetical protein HMPREF0290_1601, partial [Corynebacterium efficiens YS-314]